MAGSAFAGSWSGSWIDQASSQNGTLTIAIDGSGSMTGTVTNVLGVASQLQNATIIASGAVAFDYTYLGYLYHASGTWNLTNGSLTGTFNCYLNGQLVGGTATVSLHH